MPLARRATGRITSGQCPIQAGASKPLCYLFPRGKGLSTCLQLLKGVMHMQELSVLPGSYGESRVPELRLGQAVWHKLPDTRMRILSAQRLEDGGESGGQTQEP